MNGRQTIFSALGATLLLACLSLAPAKEFYVAPAGDDAAPGSKDRPFRTLEQARDTVRALKPSAGLPKAGVTVFLRGGVYVLDQTFVLTPEDSGSVDSPVWYRAFPGETPRLLGGREITGWQPLETGPSGVAAAARGKLWVADVPKGWRFHYLYVDGQPAERARLHHGPWRQWPKDFSQGAPDQRGQLVTFANQAQLRHLPSNGDVEMVCILAQYGVMGNGVLTDINPDAGTARWNSRQLNLRPSRNQSERGYNLENALPFLDSPGEWCVDSAAGKVYYWPPDGRMAKHQVIAPKLYELVRLQGNEATGARVHDVGFSGITFACTDRLPENEWPRAWVKRQWEQVDAAIYVQGAQDCALVDNRILHSGSSGITLDHYCQGIRIEGNEIGWPGSDGIFLCGYGPGTLNVNQKNRVTRNWIHDLGQGNYWHSAAIQIYQSGSNHVSLNLLERSAYTAVSIVGMHPNYLSNPDYFFEAGEGNAAGQCEPWNMFNLRSRDFPASIQEGVRKKTFKFDRETIKPYLHSGGNLVESNIVIEPETRLDEGGALYAWCSGTGNVWRDNLIFKSSGMPGSSILALDDLAEYFTVTGNVIWVEGRAACGTIGVRPTERGNVIRGNLRAVFKPEYADGGSGNLNGLAKGFYTTDASREPVDRMLKAITDQVALSGGWPGNPRPAIPAPGEPVQRAENRVLPKDAHVTIE